MTGIERTLSGFSRIIEPDLMFAAGIQQNPNLVDNVFDFRNFM